MCTYEILMHRLGHRLHFKHMLVKVIFDVGELFASFRRFIWLKGFPLELLNRLTICENVHISSRNYFCLMESCNNCFVRLLTKVSSHFSLIRTVIISDPDTTRSDNSGTNSSSVYHANRILRVWTVGWERLISRNWIPADQTRPDFLTFGKGPTVTESLAFPTSALNDHLCRC